MKTYEKTAADVLCRSNEIIAVKSKRKKMAARIITAAVCICTVAAVASAVNRTARPPLPEVPGNTASNQAPSADSDGRLVIDGPSLYIPKINLPKQQDTAAADMIGCVYYKGTVYTAVESYYNEECEALLPLKGEYLGKALGNLDEWSTQDEKSQELASNCTGEVYTVKGYSRDFRLCIINKFENGEVFFVILDRLNDIHLSTGAGFFEKNLLLSERAEQLLYLTHDAWNEGSLNYRSLEVTENELSDFFDELNSNRFVKVGANAYDTARQGHIFVRMNDGTTVELRLLDGGYVGYQDLGWYFVKMPGKAFDAVFNACA